MADVGNCDLMFTGHLFTSTSYKFVLPNDGSDRYDFERSRDTYNLTR